MHVLACSLEQYSCPILHANERFKLAAHLDELASRALWNPQDVTREDVTMMSILASRLCQDQACGETRVHARRVMGMLEMACPAAQLRSAISGERSGRLAPPTSSAGTPAAIPSQLPRLRQSLEVIMGGNAALSNSYPNCPAEMLAKTHAQRQVGGSSSQTSSKVPSVILFTLPDPASCNLIG
jgi:hypothetical protein